MIESQPQRFAFARLVNLLKFLRQPDDRNFPETKFFKLRARSVELAFAAVYQDEVG